MANTAASVITQNTSIVTWEVYMAMIAKETHVAEPIQFPRKRALWRSMQKARIAYLVCKCFKSSNPNDTIS